MKNSEIAKSLLELANVYGSTPDDTPLMQPNLFVHVYTKEAVVAHVKAIGGSFKKRVLYEGSDTLIFESQRIPGVDIWVPRDKICRKIPERYECEPLLSAEDEAQILNEVPA